jgi:putative peptide zinc metalloprotease protein
LVWLVVVGAGIKVALDHFAGLKDQSQGVLEPGNLPLLYLGMVVVKAAHEFGHAFACRRFGGEVHTMGIMFMIFTPMPYMDATASWSFRSRWQRVLVGVAGMIHELFLAALATFVWANTAAGTVHTLAYNMMFVASVSTVIFNINPLMRFDGYYVLSDLLDIPNLYTQANRQLIFFIEKYAFGKKSAETPAQTPREAAWLTAFGIAGHIYRIFIFSTILLFLADRFLILGIIMALVCLVSWILVPITRLLRYLATSPSLARNRPRAIAVCAGLVAVLVVLLQVVPFRNDFRAPGVVQALEHTIVANEAEGFLETLLAPSGSAVAAGDPLVRLRNRELDYEVALLQTELAEVEALELRSMQGHSADLMPIRSRREAITKRLAHQLLQQTNLVVRARHGGRWISPELHKASSAWFQRGTPLGELINTNAFYFSVIVSQKEVSRLFDNEIRLAQVRLRGQAAEVLEVTRYRVIPAEHETLPSQALGWRGGGEIPVNPNDPSGVRAVEPFFEVRALIQSGSPTTVLHGRSGKIRFQLRPEPLLDQWIRKLRQLLQKHYGL